MNNIHRLLRAGAVLGLPLALALNVHCNNGDHTGTNADLGINNPNADLTGSNGDGGSGDGGNGGDGGSTVDMTAPGGPGILMANPAFGSSAGGSALTLTGYNFPADAQVYIDGKAASLIGSVTTTQIMVTLPADAGKKGKVAIEIRRPGLGAQTTNANVFAYYLGTPQFSIPKSYSTGPGSTPYAVTLADLDNNKTLDAVVANYNGKSVGVLLGDGVGGFGTFNSYPADSGTTALTVADFDKDGHPDVATINFIAETVTVLLNPGGSGILNMPLKRALLAGTAPQGIASGLLNNDAIPDVVTANAGTNDSSVLIGQGGGSFAAPFSAPVDLGPSSVALADMNRDGKLDLVVANSNASSVSVLIGDGAGNFTLKANYSTGSAQPKGLAIADFDSDGYPDVAVPLNGGSGRFIAVLRGNADGSLKPPQPYTAGQMNGDSPFGIAAKDLNGDGLADLVVTLNGNTRVAVLLNQSGTFPAQLFYLAGLTSTCNPRGLSVEDVNGDGNPDIVVTNQSDNTISVLLNQFQ